MKKKKLQVKCVPYLKIMFDRAIKTQSHFSEQDSREMIILRNDETHM